MLSFSICLALAELSGVRDLLCCKDWNICYPAVLRVCWALAWTNTSIWQTVPATCRCLFSKKARQPTKWCRKWIMEFRWLACSHWPPRVTYSTFHTILHRSVNDNMLMPQLKRTIRRGTQESRAAGRTEPGNAHGCHRRHTTLTVSQDCLSCKPKCTAKGFCEKNLEMPPITTFNLPFYGFNNSFRNSSLQQIVAWAFHPFMFTKCLLLLHMLAKTLN